MNTTTEKHLGFGQDTIVNMVSGLFLRILKPFKQGDFIEIKGELGSVTRKGWISSEINTIDGETLTVQNSRFFTESLHNLTSKNIIRMDFTFKVSYSANMTEVKQVLFDALKKEELILDAPKPKISVVKLHPNHLEIQVSPWCLLDYYMDLESQLGETLNATMIANGFDLDNQVLRGIA